MIAEMMYLAEPQKHAQTTFFLSVPRACGSINTLHLGCYNELERLKGIRTLGYSLLSHYIRFITVVDTVYDGVFFLK